MRLGSFSAVKPTVANSVSKAERQECWVALPIAMIRPTLVMESSFGEAGNWQIREVVTRLPQTGMFRRI